MENETNSIVMKRCVTQNNLSQCKGMAAVGFCCNIQSCVFCIEKIHMGLKKHTGLDKHGG